MKWKVEKMKVRTERTSDPGGWGGGGLGWRKRKGNGSEGVG